MAKPRVSLADLLVFLKGVPLLAGLDDKALATLANVCHIEHAPKDSVIFSRGEPAQAVYIVRSGVVAEFAGGPMNLRL